METLLIVGLGNPGQEYNQTRHNIGFMIIDEIIKKSEVTKSVKFNGHYWLANNGKRRFIYLKPQTFMNRSGNCINAFMNYFQVKSHNLLIIFDDKDIPFGTLKLKAVSSSGGHNGIKSIIEQLGSNDFARLKFGINSEYNVNTRDFVLKKFSKEEQQELPLIIIQAIEVVDYFIETSNITEVMNKFNNSLK